MIKGISYTAEEIAKIVDGELCGDNSEIRSVTINSKIVSEKSCFFAIKGNKFNGADFACEAVENGAVLIVAEEKIAVGVSVIYVKSVTKALGMLAKHHKGSTMVIAVTGSVGKTTTKDMIMAVAQERYSVCGTLGNQNNEIGVALTLLSIKGEKLCVVEMGMRALGEIKWLSYIAGPVISVITNCGSAHIGELGSEENIFRAKTEALLNTEECVILPSEKRFSDIETELVKILVGDGGDISWENIQLEERQIKFDIKSKYGVCKSVLLNTMYAHNISNAVNAYTVGKLLGIDDKTIKSALANYAGNSLREDRIIIHEAEIIVDCYNASYESMSSAVSSLAGYAGRIGKKSVAIIGDMLELGDASEEKHRKIGELCRRVGVSQIFATGEYAKYYIEGFGKGALAETKDKLAEMALKILNGNCVVLIKASRKCQFEKIIELMRARE